MATEKKRTLLVVENNELSREILTSLISADYNVLEAENGKVGLELLNKNKGVISLILLDLNMPVLNGYQFLDAVNADEKYQSIPVIIVTSSGNLQNEVRCLELGASDFVLKPYMPEILLSRIKSMIRLSESTALLNKVELDSVTNIYNKDFFYEYARQTVSKNPDTAFDIICCDVESLRMVNDKYGKSRADKLLRTVAALIKDTLKSVEICGRLSGSTFAVLYVHSDDDANIMRLTAGIPEDSLPVPATILKYGLYPNVGAEDIFLACTRAQIALDCIKNQYGKNYIVYDEEIQKKFEKEQIIVSNMETALKEHQFVVYYQPKHVLKTGKIGGAEALVRWIHPVYGFMNPGEFIPLFEKNGFIGKLDYYVWEEVCKTLREWLDAGFPVVPVSVNISRIDIEIPDLDLVIEKLADKYKVPHELLHLEITESAYIEDSEALIQKTDSLRKKGFPVELDDFGTGYSSLKVFGEMDFDVLKLDISLVQSISAYKPKTVLAAVLNLAKVFKMQIVAEGVETEEQARALNEMECTYAQGYFYSKPMPRNEYEKYLTGSMEVSEK